MTHTTESTPNAEKIAAQPAFPACNEANVNGTMGMTLRDWFAGQALAGILAGLCGQPRRGEEEPTIRRAYNMLNFEHTARDSYTIADAMLAEREKGGPA